jgi:hypothetical protein
MTVSAGPNAVGVSLENISASTVAKLLTLTTTNSILAVGSEVIVYDAASCSDTTIGGGAIWELEYCNTLTSGACSQWVNVFCSSASTTPTVATPTFSLASGAYNNFLTLTLSDTTGGASIYYTTNGTTPTASSTLYSGPITVSSLETVEALAVFSGYNQSATASAAYAFAVAAPSDSPGTGSYTSTQSATLSDATSGASFVYCVSTSICTPATAYSGAVSISSTENFCYQGTLTGYASSAAKCDLYTVNPTQVSTPTFSVGAGTLSALYTIVVAAVHDGGCNNMVTTSAASVACTLTTANAGDVIVIHGFPNATGTTSVTDSLGGSATLLQGSGAPGGGAQYVSAYYIKNAAAGSHTITFNMPVSATYQFMFADAFSNVSTTSLSITTTRMAALLQP